MFQTKTIKFVPENFQTLFDLEAEFDKLCEEYNIALEALRAHHIAVHTRIAEDKGKLAAKLLALEKEEAEIKAATKDNYKKEIQAELRGSTAHSGPEQREEQLRLIEIPEQKAALSELLSDVKPTNEENHKYSELYEATVTAGRKADIVSVKLQKEIAKITPGFTGRLNAGVFNEGNFDYNTTLSQISEFYYELNGGDRA
jgi:hypothetical protein